MSRRAPRPRVLEPARGQRPDGREGQRAVAGVLDADVEELFRASRSRAAELMQLFGAELVGGALVVRRVDLLRHLRQVRDGEGFRRVEHRRSVVVEAVQRARLTGVKIAVTRDVLETRLAGLPAGVTVGPRRIEVVFDSAEEALVQLVALAQALTNDLEAFQRLVARGSRRDSG